VYLTLEGRIGSMKIYIYDISSNSIPSLFHCFFNSHAPNSDSLGLKERFPTGDYDIVVVLML